MLRSAQIGAPYLGQRVAFLFGSVIPVPSAPMRMELALPQGTAVNYWLPAPYTTNGYTNAPFYWSPNAQAVFAIQAGSIDITWQKAVPVVSQPVDATNYVQLSRGLGTAFTRSIISCPEAPPSPRKKFTGRKGRLRPRASRLTCRRPGSAK